MFQEYTVGSKSCLKKEAKMKPLAKVRQKLISAPLLRIFRKLLPPISQTEQEALDAGTVWWETDLFRGRPDWKKLHDIPNKELTEEEKDFLDGPVEKLCGMLNSWEIEKRKDLPQAIWDFIRQNGFFGMVIPKEYGGLDFSARAHSEVVTKIAAKSVSAAITVMVPNSLGPAELLLHYGTESQKKYYLPRLANGRETPCFALTAPEAGSDAASIPDRGIVCNGVFEGKEDVLGIRLNWEKRYITLGPVATILGLAFKLYDPEHLLGEKEGLGITCALIPTDTPGIEIGRRHNPLGLAFQNGPTTGRDVFIPIDWIIGGKEQAGNGWRMLMESLSQGRGISLPAMSTGAAKFVSRSTGAYARIRKQFGMPIGYFEGVEEALARIAGYTYMMDAARCLTTSAIDEGERPSVVSAIVKYNLTERMRKIVNDAMDIQGGSAISMGPRNPLAHAYHALPISITVEGANILTRSLIIFGQGAIRCHPFILDEIAAAHNPDKKHAVKDFDRALFGHIRYLLANAVRAFWYGITGARFSTPVERGVRLKLKPYYRKLTCMSATFALVSDVALLTLGGSLKRKEKISGRLADALGNLYLASSVLKHFWNDAEPEGDRVLAKWACEDLLYAIQESIDGVLRNLPARPIAWLLRLLVFPLGKRCKQPSDKLGHEVARILLAPSETRDRLTRGIYIPRDVGEPLGRLEDALEKVCAVASIEKSLRDAARKGRIKHEMDFETAIAKGVLRNSAEAHSVTQAHKARLDVITVDDFEDLN
ncbi:MAG: acyl-CoA dehydrogenase FadE [Patescibacteria group bacterium]|nr:MAG: acyl-CoA dehydrogenase FadE [Patescibacteria group bacterium]